MVEIYRLRDGAPLFGELTVLEPTAKEALAVLEREVSAARAPRAEQDPLAARVTRLNSRDRQYVEDLVRGLEENPSSPEPGQRPPEKGK